MKNSILCFTLAASLACMSVCAQQVKIPAASPTQTLKQNFALGEVTVEYSRPAMKGRAIFGDVVPFDKVWRTGANSTTKITFTDDVKLEGHDVKAGTYGLYTMPGKKTWQIMLYKDLTLAGNVADYKAENEVLRFQVTPVAVKEKAESFTIAVADVLATSATLQIMWDKTCVPVKITADIDSRIMSDIDKSLASEKPNYFAAASYYYDNNKDLSKALTWVKKAMEQNPKAFYMAMVQARIELKMGDKAAATASAQKTITLAKEAKNDDYVRMAEKLIADAK